MNPTSSHNFRKLVIALIILGVTGMSLLATRYGVNPLNFSGNIVQPGGIANKDLDPLKSGRACFATGSGTLSVIDLVGVTFDWRVSPAAKVIAVVGGVPDSQLIGVGPNVIFTAPASNDPNIATSYTVDVVVNGAVPGTGETFQINIGPSCVESLEFINPSGTVAPSNGEVQINTIRAVLSNGESVNYNGAEIGQLGIKFVADPPGQIQFVGNVIRVPFEHQETKIFMELRGNAIPPKTFDKTNLVAGNAGVYELESDEVDPASVAVFDATGGLVGSLFERGVDYRFNDIVHDADATTNDEIVWINGGIAAPADLFIAYLYRDSSAVLRTKNPLVIGASQCELLEANLYQGRGQGFFLPGPGITPGKSSVSEPLHFGDASPDGQMGNETPIESVTISNRNVQGVTFGSSAFELKFKLKQGLRERASLVNKSGSTYEIEVRKEVALKESAANFAYAVNTLFGNTAAFVAFIDPANDERVILHSMEVGTHTNQYLCSVNGSAFTHPNRQANSGFCFDGGINPVNQNNPNQIIPVDPPRPLDPVLAQGETRMVYSRGGFSDLIWRSSDASILSVEALSEAADQNKLLGNENVTLNAAALNAASFQVPQAGDLIASATNCVKEPVGNPPVETLKTCLVTIKAPVKFKADPNGYSIAITPVNGNPVPGIVQGSDVDGILIGSDTIDSVTGGAIRLTGQMTVSVGGSAIGTLKVDVNMLISIAPFNAPAQINTKWNVASVSGQLSKIELIPTNRNPNGGNTPVTNFAILTGKRPGKATLFVTDKLGCSAPLDVEVLGQKLFIDFENPDQGEFLEQGDSIQLRAWTGFKGGINSENDVTNTATWEVDEGVDVVKVSATGRLTALKPGVANVFARYSTGIGEQGNITSEGRLRIHVNELDDLTISLTPETLNRFSVEERVKAYSSVAIVIHEPGVAGRSLVIEGEKINISFPGTSIPYASELDQIKDLAISLIGTIQGNATLGPQVNATMHPTLAGVILLESTNSNVNKMVDITTTALAGEMTLVPAFSDDITLPRNETYQMMVIGEYKNGRTRRLLNTDATWISTPVNTLNDAALVTGLLKRGDKAGTATVNAEVKKGESVLRSRNALTVKIEEGPVIEFVRLLTNGSLVKGSPIELLAEISDIDNLDDIQQITASLVRTEKIAYADINKDPAAAWFAVSTFLDKTQKVEAPADDKEGEEGDKAPEAPEAPLFSQFRIPMNIPVDANLFDGPYKLILSVTDRSGRSTHFVMPILIGKVASGDVNGDGKITMIDVILAFQIANGKLVPTQQQLAAANLDGRGGVTMIDVILLFQKVNR